jgi:ADP-ribose pyrophosphatase
VSAPTRFVVVGVGLSNDVLSPEPRHLAGWRSVGRRESARLLGRGRALGDGPLPRFLSEVAETEGLSLVWLSHAEPDGADDERDGTALAPVEPLAPACRAAQQVRTGRGSLALRRLVDAVAEVVESEPEALLAGEVPLRFLVVGCDTDKRVMGVATFLRNLLGAAEVGVAAPLVGSTTQIAHHAALRHNLPRAGVRVFLDLEEAASFMGLEPSRFTDLGCRPCDLGPEELRAKLPDDALRVVQLLCLHWTRAELRVLQGGFSDSLLLLAEGWKGDYRTEPVVLKIDRFGPMRRELEGYHQVKDLLGKHVPTFGTPVEVGELLGVTMELAAMEGRPETLQDVFEAAVDDQTQARFMGRLDKALSLLVERLHGNTRGRSWVVPYRAFWLHTKQQVAWFEENAALALAYAAEAGHPQPNLALPDMARALRAVAGNEDGVAADTCVVHGDLNLANVICDATGNVWFVDWTHCDHEAFDLDFAKLESDVKFVASKQFDFEDLPRLRKLEDYLLSTRLLPEPDALPDELKFARWDLRFRKIVAAVGRIRAAGFRGHEEWLIYRIALLRHALHTLSFDARRGRGECAPQQLVYALHSVDGLLRRLAALDFHVMIRAERPSTYPPRVALAVADAPWSVALPSYAPPYHVEERVRAAAAASAGPGWADPEDFALVAAERAGASPHLDAEGRPLHPGGRTGIAGRGRLGRWGPNLTVAGVITRSRGHGAVELLVGRKPGRESLSLPKGFVFPQESPRATLARVLADKFGIEEDAASAVEIFAGPIYDRRQTDHAWVEVRGYLLHASDGLLHAVNASAAFDEVVWHPLTADTVNHLSSGHAHLVREAIRELQTQGVFSGAEAERLLARTG